MLASRAATSQITGLDGPSFVGAKGVMYPAVASQFDHIADVVSKYHEVGRVASRVSTANLMYPAVASQFDHIGSVVKQYHEVSRVASIVAGGLDKSPMLESVTKALKMSPAVAAMTGVFDKSPALRTIIGSIDTSPALSTIIGSLAQSPALSTIVGSLDRSPAFAPITSAAAWPVLRGVDRGVATPERAGAAVADSYVEASPQQRANMHTAAAEGGDETRQIMAHLATAIDAFSARLADQTTPTQTTKDLDARITVLESQPAERRLAWPEIVAVVGSVAGVVQVLWMVAPHVPWRDLTHGLVRLYDVLREFEGR